MTYLALVDTNQVECADAHFNSAGEVFVIGEGALVLSISHLPAFSITSFALADI